jgi:hydrogenase maturation protein HypF
LAPPAARFRFSLRLHRHRAFRTADEFEIVVSLPDRRTDGFRFTLTCDCDDCLSEIFDPPTAAPLAFTNCHELRARVFTIATDIPYDRRATTDGPVEMCPPAAAKYTGRVGSAIPTRSRTRVRPAVRGSTLRAPDGCPPPRWTMSIAVGGESDGDGDLALCGGRVGLSPGLDATSGDAVPAGLLRERNARDEKAFAVMVPVAARRRRARVRRPRRAPALTSPERRIVLVRKRPGGRDSREEVAPRNQIGRVAFPALLAAASTCC